MSFFWLIGALVFALGAAVGSFLNALVYRSIHAKDWVRGRSVCEHCGARIAWYENIPVLSYLVLRGECSHCHTKIDPIHPFVELMTGTLFVWWYVAGSLLFRLSSPPFDMMQPLFWLAAGIVGVVIFVSDVRYMLIPTWAVTALTIGALGYRLVLVHNGAMQRADFFTSIMTALALAAFFGALWLLTKKKGFGSGDILLAFPLGLLLGSWQRIVVATLTAFVSGAVVGIGLLLFGRKKLKQAVPFGPFLLAGTLVALVWGYDLWEWYVTMFIR